MATIKIKRINGLRELFLDGMKRKRKEIATTSYGSGCHYPYPNSFMHTSLRIYFYEWSDLNATPRVFYELKYYDTFLRNCGIMLEKFQRDIIENLGYVYTACYKGSKEVCIRGSFHNLKQAIEEREAVDKKRKEIEEKRSSTIPILHVGNTMPQNDGTFFG